MSIILNDTQCPAILDAEKESFCLLHSRPLIKLLITMITDLVGQFIVKVWIQSINEYVKTKFRYICLQISIWLNINVNILLDFNRW